MFDKNVKPYSQDLPLFEELGLEPFDIPHHTDEHHVGTVERGSGYVKIFVSTCPSQFWSFEVLRQGSVRRYKLSCGSGSLKDYWEIAEKVMTGMVVVTEIDSIPLTGVSEDKRKQQLLDVIEIKSNIADAYSIYKRVMDTEKKHKQN